MEFKPRMTRPTSKDKYYVRKANGGYSNAIKGSPEDTQCDVLSNCVGYAYGRFNEIGGYGFNKYLAPVNAEKFIQYKGSCEVGQTPKLGACMVWQKGSTLDGSDGAGHVAIVEKVVSDTEVVTSESAWGSSTPFYTRTRTKGSNGRWGCGSGYTFLGFIYNPAVEDEPQTSSPNFTSNDIVYTVAKGDTLRKIASKYGTTYQKLATYNNISNPNLIRVGQEIRIPSPELPSVHTVQKGDTLTKIAAKYGTTTSALIAHNKISNPNVIYIGQKIKIPR